MIMLDNDLQHMMRELERFKEDKLLAEGAIKEITRRLKQEYQVKTLKEVREMLEELKDEEVRLAGKWAEELAKAKKVLEDHDGADNA